jgi:hypothetical protein
LSPAVLTLPATPAATPLPAAMTHSRRCPRSSTTPPARRR